MLAANCELVFFFFHNLFLLEEQAPGAIHVIYSRDSYVYRNLSGVVSLESFGGKRGGGELDIIVDASIEDRES